MKYIILFIGIFMMKNLYANGESFDIKIGNVTLSVAIPDARTGRAPDIPLQKYFDICEWLKDENNQKQDAQKELLRKVWEFKKFLKAPTGSFVFTVSVVKVNGFENNLKRYYDDVAEATLQNLKSMADRGYTDHNYTPAEGYEELTIDGQLWMRYFADNKSAMYYRTFIGDGLVLRLNLLQSDSRKNAVKGEWHPKADSLAKIIVESIKLNSPKNGQLCDC